MSCPQVPCPPNISRHLPIPLGVEAPSSLNLSHSGREQETARPEAVEIRPLLQVGTGPEGGQEACSQKGPGMLWQAGDPEWEDREKWHLALWACNLDCLTCPVQWHTHHHLAGHWWHKEHVPSVCSKHLLCIMSFKSSPQPYEVLLLPLSTLTALYNRREGSLSPFHR